MSKIAATNALPYPWEARQSQSTGDTYYVNSSTGETTWTLPAAALKAQQIHQQKLLKKRKKELKKAGKKLPPGWELGLSRAGETYYFHPESEHSQFEFPRALAKGWTYAKSRTSGETYYVCKSGPRAGEQTYEHPGYGDDGETLCC